MYPNYINDRKSLGYECLLDTQCGNRLVLITDSSVVFVKNVTLNLKTKSKRIVVVISLATVVCFSNVESISAIGLPIPPVTVVRVHKPSYDYGSKIKVAPAVSRKLDKISFIKYRELPLSIYAMDKDFIVRPEIRKIIRELRVGDLSEALVGNAILLLVLDGIWTLVSGADGFQIPVVPPRNGAVIAPANGGVHQQINHPKHGGKITVRMSNSQQVSTNVIPTQTQMSGFVKNGKVNLHKCLDEVNRRASEIGCADFECSMERFRSLATENGEFTNSTAREAITILEGEMHGYYRNARRENYGVNVTGLDFIVEGIGDFENITHVEVKNPVGSAIKIANGQKGSISKQGKKIGAKINYQQNLWSNPNEISKIPNMTIKTNANFPDSPSNVLGLVDNFDVPVHEKSSMEASVLKGYNETRNIIFLNNVTNV